MGRTIGQRVRKKLLKRVAFPLMNRLLSDSGQHLYHYSPNVDRLFAIQGFGSETYKYFASGSFDSDTWWNALQRLELDRGIILDVGANTGYSATWFSTIADRVVAFEPNPENVRLLREHLRIRRIPNVQVIESAVSDRSGSATLYCKPRSGHHSLGDIGASETLGTIEVPCTTIDAFMDQSRIDRVALLKIDVEGFEPEVLNGAKLGLSSGSIERVMFEHNPAFYSQRGIDVELPVTTLDQLGFVCHFVTGEPFAADDPRARLQCDLLAFAPGVPGWAD
jgi:FkbM family methyltransferase